MTLGQKIRQARIERGLTQKQLVGEHITRNMLSKIENDSATPSVRTLEYLASRLGVSPGYFMSDMTYSDGTSPDGLDEMREAYRQKDYAGCIRLLESARTQSTTDEGYLLHTLAAACAARDAIRDGDAKTAREYADAADYYNKEGLYYSPEIDAEMSLILAECALDTELAEFEENISEYERAEKSISLSQRYYLARAEYLLRTGETELAARILDNMGEPGEEYAPRAAYLTGLRLMGEGQLESARETLLRAEESSPKSQLPRIYAALEMCYRELEDYKQAYHYASKRLSALE